MTATSRSRRQAEDELSVADRCRLELSVRAKRLASLGYSSYAEYIRAKHWHLTRSAYFAHPDTPKRCFCGEHDERLLRLHHRTYVRIGAEDLRDLQPLCDRCHHDVHRMANIGVAPYDLDDYADDTRRREYAEHRAAELERRGELPDRNPDAPYDDFNWRTQARLRHAEAQDRRERARQLRRSTRTPRP